MLNYGITQNEQFALGEDQGEATKYDLSLYEALGDNAFRVGNANEALSWYAKGLSIAREIKNNDKVRLFTNLIYVSL